jgi:hypothetical protein
MPTTIDSSTINYAAPYTNSVPRTGQSKYSDIISVKDFGATSTGTADSTAQFQAAINAAAQMNPNGVGVFIPAGTYNLSGTLTIPTGITLYGESRYGTILNQRTLSATTLNISGSFCGVNSLSIMYDGTPQPGGTAINITGAYATLEDFVIRSCYIGTHFNGANAVAGKMTNFEIFDYEQVGIFCQSLNDVFVSSFILNAGDTTRGRLGGIRLQDKVEAFICTDGDILLGAYSMTTDATQYSVGNRPAYNNFTNVFFDSSANGVLFNRSVETDFVGCWFSGGRVGTGNNGMIISNTDSIRFTNTRWDNNGASGCYVANTAVRTTFTACKFEGNSVSAGAGRADGLVIEPNTQHFQILGCVAQNGLLGGQQRWGINVSPNCNYYIIQNNDLIGNQTGGIANTPGTSATRLVSNNLA